MYLLLRMFTVLWMGWEGLSMMTSSLVSICLDVCGPAHHIREDGVSHNKLIKHREQLVVYIEGPEPPEEVEPFLYTTPV